MWNRYQSTPWLLRFFDQIRFYPVSADELLHLRDECAVKMEPAEFSLSEYNAFLASILPETEQFKTRQQAAFEAERERWKLAPYESEPLSGTVPIGDDAVPPGCERVRSSVTANVWKILVQPGEQVQAGQKLAILEAMKMEILIAAHQAGAIVETRCSESALVTGGQTLFVIATQ